MTALPPSTDFTGSGVTQGQFKTAISSLRTYVADLLGTDSTDTAAARSLLGITELNLGEGALTQYYHPASGSAFQDMYRSGWLPSWFNQQWGGSQWGTLPDGSFGSVATGNVEDDLANAQPFSGTAPQYYVSTGFKVSDTATFDAVWVKLYKNGNPTYNITARIYSNSAGSPSSAIGSAATISAKVLTSKTDGEWYQITGLNCALTAGTQYHLVLSSLAAVDPTNYVTWKAKSTNKYPHGFMNFGTSAPVWTQYSAFTMCFLIQNPAANSLIQSGGEFDYKLSFAAGSPVNQSRSVAQPLVNFYDGKTCSVLHRGTYAVSTNVWDFTYGLDHDRITVTINSSGYPVLTIYESDRTVATVTGTGSVASGFHDVGIRVRTVGDGADYATLYVDGVSVGTPLTSQTFTMDVNMVTLGTARLGDGFGLAPTWTQDMQMTSLPSAQGWTWTGTGTEANCMSIQNNKLYQNANGYASTDTGYYAKTVVLNNTTGWAVSAKIRVPTSPSSNITSYFVNIDVYDGSKNVAVIVNEYFAWVSGNSGTADFVIQGDFKSQDHVFTLCGKGADYYLLIDGKLAVDGTGKLVGATATNSIRFGDNTGGASANADAIWSYVKYYQGGMLLPTANTGTCSEFAHWSGDKSALFPSLYNSGSPVSVKQLCGVPRNYQFEQVVQRLNLRDVTTATTSSTSLVVTPEMEGYVIGSGTSTVFHATNYNDTLGATISGYVLVDGVQVTDAFDYFKPYANGISGTVASMAKKTSLLGLRKIDHRWKVSSNTGGRVQSQITVEARS